MPYELPDNPVPDDFIKVCVTIPNRREYVRAFLASYSQLARWTIWEREPTQSGAIAAHYFLIAYNETVDNWVSCGEGEGEMTTVINNNYVNCGCGCTGDNGGVTTLYCVLSDGTVDITPQPPSPTEPTPPPGGEFPLDPSTDPAPDGFADWTEFDERACLASNISWYFALWFIRIIEGLGDVVAVLAVALTLVSPLLPAGVLAAIGGVVFMDILKQLRDIVLSEQASDILNEIEEWLIDNRQSIVCKIFSHRYDYEFALQAADGITDYVELSVLMSPEERNAVQQLAYNMFAYTLFGAVIVGDIAETFGLEAEFTDVDCTACAGGSFSIFDAFLTNTLNNVGWDDVRVDAPTGFAELNATDVNSARFFLTAGLMDTYWNQPVSEVGTNVRLRFSWRVLERATGTHAFAINVKNASGNVLQDVGGLAAYVGSVPVGQWQSFDRVIPFNVGLDSIGGQNILQFVISTTSSRLRVAVDNVRFEGDIV